MVMIGFGVATFHEWATGATSILQAVIFSKPEAPVEERQTGSFLLFLRFLRSCAWCGCRCTRFSDCGVMTYRIPRHTGCPLHSSREGFVEDPVYVRLCGAEEGSLLLLLLCRWLSLACSGHPSISNNLQAEVAQKA
jgi:hypothetical protein